MRRSWADKPDIVVGENFRKTGILGKKAVARMHRVRAGDLAGGEQRRNVEVAVARGRRADAHALFGKPHMHGVLVGGGMHGDGRNAQLLAGAQHTQRDLAAICDQNLVKHRRSFIPLTDAQDAPEKSGRACACIEETGVGFTR